MTKKTIRSKGFKVLRALGSVAMGVALTFALTGCSDDTEEIKYLETLFFKVKITQNGEVLSAGTKTANLIAQNGIDQSGNPLDPIAMEINPLILGVGSARYKLDPTIKGSMDPYTLDFFVSIGANVTAPCGMDEEAEMPYQLSDDKKTMTIRVRCDIDVDPSTDVVDTGTDTNTGSNSGDWTSSLTPQGIRRTIGELKKAVRGTPTGESGEKAIAIKINPDDIRKGNEGYGTEEPESKGTAQRGV